MELALQGCRQGLLTGLAGQDDSPMCDLMSMLKSFFCRVFYLALSMAMLSIPAINAADDEIPPQILIDLDSREVLAHQNAFRRWPPASLTKMMTAYVVFRALKMQQVALNSPVRISNEALAEPPTKMGFPVGTVLTIDNSLKIIMVKSANDISVAIAEAIAGSEWKFIQLMNSHARRLGMDNTNFVNPNGLPEEGQYTTARDFALLTLALTHEFPEYRYYFNIPAIKIGKRRLRNHNALLEQFDGTNGMKTGYVCASGSNVAVRVEREGRRLAAVVLGGRSSLVRNVRAAKLLQEGFDGLYNDNAIAIENFQALDPVDPERADITRIICPRKYAKMPKKKKAEVHTAGASGGKRVVDPKMVLAYASTGLEAGRVPDSSTGRAPVIEEYVVEGVGEKEEDIPEDKPPSFAELKSLYLGPRKKVGDDVVVTFGGAVGPNPMGLRHKDGGFAEPIIPVPTKRPDPAG